MMIPIVVTPVGILTELSAGHEKKAPLPNDRVRFSQRCQ